MRRYLAIVVLAALAGCAGAPTAAVPTGSSGIPTAVSVTVPTAEVAAPARAYVDAVNNGNLEGLVRAFAENGEIMDVSRRISGPEAIRAWAAREVIGGTLRVLAVTPKADGQDLLVHWAPSGSDGWRAHYRFTFAGDRIALADLQYA